MQAFRHNDGLCAESKDPGDVIYPMPLGPFFTKEVGSCGAVQGRLFPVFSNKWWTPH